MKKSVFTFGLLMSSLVMLSAMPIFRQQSVQWHKNMTNMEIVLIAHTQQATRNMNVRTGPFEGFFVCSVEFCKHVKFDDNNDVEDGNGVGGNFCILESLEGCFQQHVDKSKLETIKQAFELE